MKILHITCFDNGGAGTAALRLHKGLLRLGVESKILVLEKRTDTPHVYEFERRNKYYVLFQRVLKNLGFPQTLEHYNDNWARKFQADFEYFSFAQSSFANLVNHPLVRECDVINLHWVANFLDYKSFFKYVDKPIVWTQHDMNAFQGGFHYKEDDIRNKDILSEINNEQYQSKLKAISGLPKANMSVVSPSKWLCSEALGSEILGRFKHYHIPNGIDPCVFHLKDLAAFKKKYGFNPKKTTVLFVSESINNIRKGFNFISELVNDSYMAKKCEFIAVGKVRNSQKIPGIKYLGSVNSEEKISEIYSAADLYLLASREDNLPNVMLESLASGTPVVAFNIGGMKDLIVNDFNGFLSDELTTQGLREALSRCIENLSSLNKSEIANQLSSKYNLEIQANSYLNVYQKFGKTDDDLSRKDSKPSEINR